jgi:DNA-binding protein HU-beta
MNKEELVTAVAAKTGMTKKTGEETVNAVFDTIADVIRDGDKVTISGFGTFFLAERAARTGRNPRTGEEVHIAARKVPRFIPGKKLKEMAR